MTASAAAIHFDGNSLLIHCSAPSIRCFAVRIRCYPSQQRNADNILISRGNIAAPTSESSENDLNFEEIR
jgi:hypothetical protein